MDDRQKAGPVCPCFPVARMKTRSEPLIACVFTDTQARLGQLNQCAVFRPRVGVLHRRERLLPRFGLRFRELFEQSRVNSVSQASDRSGESQATVRSFGGYRTEPVAERDGRSL